MFSSFHSFDVVRHLSVFSQLVIFVIFAVGGFFKNKIPFF